MTVKVGRNFYKYTLLQVSFSEPTTCTISDIYNIKRTIEKQLLIFFLMENCLKQVNVDYEIIGES